MSPKPDLYQTSANSPSPSLNSAFELAAFVKPGIVLAVEESKTQAQLAAIAADKARASGLLSGLIGDNGSLISVSRAKEISVD